MSASVSGKPKRGAWPWSVLAANAGITGFAYWVPLYILRLGGTVVEVALLTSLYNLVVIPSSVFWGRMTDRLARRRFFFLVSFSGAMAVFMAMYLLQSLNALTILYAILGIVTVANAPAIGLLVMETSEKSDWVTSYSWIALLSTSGSVLGTFAGLLWVSVYPLASFMIFCAACAGLSLILAFFLISEPAVPLETIQLVLLPATRSRAYHRLTFVVHHLFIGIFSPVDIVKRIRVLKKDAMTGRSLLLLSAFVSYAGGSMISTPFTPFLASRGVPNNEIFAVYSIYILLAIVVYRWIRKFINAPSGMKSVLNVILIRPILILILASSAVLFIGDSLFVIAAVFYGLLGATFAIWNSATSVALYSSLGETRQGNILGWYTAVSYLGLVVGSFFSGYLASFFGYPTTFTIGAALTLATFFIQNASFRNLGYVNLRPTSQK
jgi:MFS family permease